MRKILSIFIVFLFIFGCTKVEKTDSHFLIPQLKSQLRYRDFQLLDQQSIVIYSFKDKEILRARVGDKELVALFSSDHLLIQGKLLAFDFQTKKIATGIVAVYQLDGSLISKQELESGRVVSHDHTLQLQSNSLKRDEKTDCTDCTLPEVIVAASYKNGETNYISFYSMMWLFGSSWGYTTYMPMYSDAGGVGGGGGGAPVEVDPPAKNQNKIDPKKYTDCFNQVSSELATYSMTIHADLPVDQDAGIVFDPESYFAGHAFIELNKSNPSASARQVFGFYPGSRLGAVMGGNTVSKIVDDSGHEFQASYTVTITQNQFNAAVQRILELNGHYYNISNFNCVDFALGVFQSGGGNLSLQTQYNIPVYGGSGGNNTPNGLYEQIAAMQAAGVPGTQANSNKNTGPQGKGPCE